MVSEYYELHSSLTALLNKNSLSRCHNSLICLLLVINLSFQFLFRRTKDSTVPMIYVCIPDDDFYFI